MRGKAPAQPDFLTVLNLNGCVPADHPLRAIKRRLDAVLKDFSPLFDDLYEELGCPACGVQGGRAGAGYNRVRGEGRGPAWGGVEQRSVLADV